MKTKRNKRKVLVLALIVSLIAILSIGSLAWFTAGDEVTNTIKMEKNFSVDVYETDEGGAAITDDGETIGATYTDVMPGQKIHKDPTVWNDGDHPEWVRVKVTLSSYKVWETTIKAGTDLSKIFGGFEPTAWTRFDVPEIDQTANTVTYTFYLNEKLAPNATATLFTDVTIPGELTMGDVSDMPDGTFTIKVAAEAIQAEFLPEDVDTAQEAFALLAD